MGEDPATRLFLVPVDTEGVTIKEMGSSGLDEMCAVYLDRVHVSNDTLIDDHSPHLAEDLHLLGAIGTSARLTGIAQRAWNSPSTMCRSGSSLVVRSASTKPSKFNAPRWLRM